MIVVLLCGGIFSPSLDFGDFPVEGCWEQETP